MIGERFWSKVDKTGECWLWTGSLNRPEGYGRVRIGGRLVSTHRVAYELAVGPIPEGMEIDHRPTCPKHCVRPDHLRLATRKQNQENQAGAYRNSKSGVRGVSWNAANQKWHTQVQHDGKPIFCGQYETIEEAEAVVVAKRLELFTHNSLDRGVW